MSAAPRLTPIADETRRVLSLAWPVMLTSLNWTILQVTDVIVVGMVGTEQAAILGASRSLTFVTVVTGLAWLSGVLVYAAQADGADDARETGAVFRAGLLLAALIGVVGAVLLGFGAGPILARLGVAPALVAPAAHVVAIMALSYPCQLILLAASFFLEGVSQPRRVMAVNLGMLPLNALLAWACSGGHFGLPVMGAAGAAAATALVSLLGSVAMLGAVWFLPGQSARGVRLFTRAAWAPVPVAAARLARFGFIPAISSGLELAGFAILIALSTEFGDGAAHAFQIVFSIHNVTFGVAIGLGSAAGVRAGNAVGEGDPVRAIPRTLIAVALSALAVGALALAIALERHAIVAGFPATAEVHGLALAMLLVWVPFIVFDGIQLVLLYALRSLGDQVVAGINGAIAYFVVTGGAGWWLVHAGYGPMGLVYASGAGMVTAAALHGGRFAMVSLALRRKSSAPASSR